MRQPLTAKVSRILHQISPSIHRDIRNIYWTAKGLYARWIGTRYFERRWSRQEVANLREDFSNLQHPHRQWLMQHLELAHPFTSALEIGCGYGPNVQLLATKFNNVEVVGLDINSHSVQLGTNKLSELGIEKARLVIGKADDLSQFDDQQFDVVFTDATLLYIGPDKIDKVIAEMKRVCRQALICMELHRPCFSHENSEGISTFTPSGWVRDYHQLLSRFFPSNSISISKIPKEVWPAENWINDGYLITAIRRQKPIPSSERA